jgi:glucosamine-6-phosphate deaminase
VKLIVVDDYEALSRAGADLMASVIADKRDAARVLATGDSPMGIYAELAAQYARGEIDTSGLRAFQLDEYLGVPPDDRRSLYGWMERSFVRPLGIPEANVVRLPWDEARAVEGCAAYERAVAQAGGFDLAVLGLGPNGHLGFNEPPCGPDDPTRVVELTEESIESNARYWGGRDTVPRRAVTTGMDRLMWARQILLVVSGARKQEILRRTVDGPVTAEVPSSYLQQAANVVVLADREAWPSGDAIDR